MGSRRVPPTLRSAIATARLMVAGNNPTPPNLKAPIERPGFGIQVAIGRSTIAPALFNFRIIPHPIFFHHAPPTSRNLQGWPLAGLSALARLVGPRIPGGSRHASGARHAGAGMVRKRMEPVRAACVECGGLYGVYRPQQRFCRGLCRQRHHRRAHAELFARLVALAGELSLRSTFRGFCGSRRGGGRLTAGR